MQADFFIGKNTYMPEKNSMTGWRIPVFNRKYINSCMENFQAMHMSFRGGKV